MFNEKNVSFVDRKKLWEYYNEKLSKGVDIGWNDGFEIDDTELVQSLKNSIAEFSAFKETAFRKDLEELLTKDGKLMPWSEFKKEAFKLSGDYNARWLETEYHQTIAQANAAAQWKDFEKNVDLYPNLKLVSVNDARVRPEHKVLNGTIRPFNDPFWNNNTPPLDWGCRCHIEQTDEDETEIKGGVQMKIEFENNPGKTGKVFGGTAYENRISVSEKKEAKKNVEKWSEKDYKLLNDNDRFNIERERAVNRGIDKVYSSLNQYESTCIHMYSMPDAYYGHLNNFNRHGKIRLGARADGFNKDTLELMTNTINTALDKIPDRFKGTVYRGTDLTYEQLKQYEETWKNKTEHIEKGFMSTTTARDKVFEGDTLFVVEAKNGTKIDKLSAVSGEDEVLFKNNQKFKIKDIQIDKNGQTIYMEEI